MRLLWEWFIMAVRPTPIGHDRSCVCVCRARSSIESFALHRNYRPVCRRSQHILLWLVRIRLVKVECGRKERERERIRERIQERANQRERESSTCFCDWYHHRRDYRSGIILITIIIIIIEWLLLLLQFAMHRCSRRTLPSNDSPPSIATDERTQCKWISTREAHTARHVRTQLRIISIYAFEYCNRRRAITMGDGDGARRTQRAEKRDSRIENQESREERREKRSERATITNDETS